MGLGDFIKMGHVANPKNELPHVIPQNHGIHHLPWYFPGRQEKAQTEPVAVAALPAEGAASP